MRFSPIVNDEVMLVGEPLGSEEEQWEKFPSSCARKITFCFRLFLPPQKPRKILEMSARRNIEKKNLKRYMNGCLFLGWERTKFIIYMCFLPLLRFNSWGAAMNSFFSLSKHSSSSMPLRETKGGERNELWQVSVQPWKVYHAFYFAHHRIGAGYVECESREIICKNRFNFKFIFFFHPSTPCVLYWFWYYRYHSSNDDVFFLSHLCPFFAFPFVCFEAKVFFIKRTEWNWRRFICFFCENIFQQHLGLFGIVCVMRHINIVYMSEMLLLKDWLIKWK